MNVNFSAMVSAIGAVFSDEEPAPTQVAEAEAYLGPGTLTTIRADFASQPPDVPERERVAAILACVWMAQADHVVVEAERRLLGELVRGAGVPPWRQGDLLAALDRPVALQDITRELTHPYLRELVLALGWGVAAGDDEIVPKETAALAAMAEAFEIGGPRVTQIREAALGIVGTFCSTDVASDEAQTDSKTPAA